MLLGTKRMTLRKCEEFYFKYVFKKEKKGLAQWDKVKNRATKMFVSKTLKKYQNSQ